MTSPSPVAREPTAENDPSERSTMALAAAPDWRLREVRTRPASTRAACSSSNPSAHRLFADALACRTKGVASILLAPPRGSL
jgi:hypothetical protein